MGNFCFSDFYFCFYFGVREQRNMCFRIIVADDFITHEKFTRSKKKKEFCCGPIGFVLHVCDSYKVTGAIIPSQCEATTGVSFSFV